MAWKGPSLSAEEVREQLRAETGLAKLDLLEELAQLHDSEPLVHVRQILAARYRRAVGVFPEQRESLRIGLNRILEGGRSSVGDLLEILHREDQANG